jgi:hypothetical protein
MIPEFFGKEVVCRRNLAELGLDLVCGVILSE